MLKLQNVCKTYVTKSKVGTVALQDVNLEIADCGMVFILGKSGSGKSTLLNLLGGLDNPTSGEIFVAGVSMQKFSPRDYANYRNNYVGFVFQEYNLLADFNVRDNVALALKLNRVENEDEKIAAALKQVELDGAYLLRRIGEMSGGEKQRIAIARALIKDSKLILADEPTGNLDSATSKSIWNILKNLSKERLVVVVSHDRESAEKYADRTIEIADGKIISDVGEQPATSAVVAKGGNATENADQQAIAGTAEPKVTARKAKPAQSRLSFATRLKMAWRNLSLRKFRAVSVVLVAVFCILSMLIAQITLCYSPEVSLARYIKSRDIDYFIVRQGEVDSSDKRHQGKSPYLDVTKNYIASKSRYIYDGVVENKQAIIDFGLSFYTNALELDDNSFYATMDVLEGKSSSIKVKINDAYVPFDRDNYPLEFLVGKNIAIDWGTNEADKCVLAGIVDTSSIYNKYLLPNYFYNKNFDAFLETNTTLNISREKEVALQCGANQHSGAMKVSSVADTTSTSVAIVSADGSVTAPKDITLADNEIVLPFSIYMNLFEDSNYQTYYYDNGKVLHVPERIGQSFSMKFVDAKSGKLIVDYGELKLVGVSMEIAPYPEILVNERFARQASRDLGTESIVIQTSSIRNLTGFLRTLGRYHGYVYTVGGDTAKMAYGIGNDISLSYVIYVVIAAVLLVLLVLLVINLISYSVANRKKEMGILSALGASNGDLTSIFLLETVIISAIVFVIVMVLSLVLTLVFNLIYSKLVMGLYYTFSFLRVDVLTVAISAVSSFGLLLLAALIPLRKIIKLKPIDAIRNN